MSTVHLPHHATMPAMATIAVVTGASRGLGQAIVSTLLDHNYHVICGQRTMPPQFNPNSNLRMIPLDLASNQSIQTFTEVVIDQLPYIDLLVNNAAICPDYPSEVHDVHEHWRSVMQVNFFAHVQLTTRLLPLLQRSSKLSRIINISSGDGELLYFESSLRTKLVQVSGLECVPSMVQYIQRLVEEMVGNARDGNIAEKIFNGQPAYKLSKAAINVYTQVAARTYSKHATGHSIRFVSICPGDVDTAMADEGVYTISPVDAVHRMWPVLEVNIPCPNGVFMRDNKLIPW